jgi:hypothetical protein
MTRHPVCPVRGPVPIDPGTSCRHASRTPGSQHHSSPRIVIDVLTPRAAFVISETPAMPAIEARARFADLSPDPTDHTKFEWSAVLHFSASGCSHGGNRETSHSPIPVQTTLGKQIYSLRFSEIRGGDLTLSVKASIGNKVHTARTHLLKIKGTNPTLRVLSAAIPHDTLRRIARHESRLRQFLGHPDGGTSNCPLYSSDNLGGVGLFQITYPLKTPHPTPDQIWDWTENIAAAVELLDSKVIIARNYPHLIRSSTHYKHLVAQFNEARMAQKLPHVTITLPDFTSGDFDQNLKQVELDAVRGYNGWAGYDGFGHHLHEFRIPLDDDGQLIVNVAPQGKTGVIEWERVLADDRPNSGDPNYVENILKQALF